MGELHLKAIVSGLLLGAWPLFMNRSGLNPYVSAVMFSAIALVVLLPAAFISNGSSLMNGRWMVAILCLFLVFIAVLSVAVMNSNLTAGATWRMVLAAALCGAFGLLLLTGILAGTTPNTVSAFFVLVLVFQLSVPAIYHVVLNGMSVSKLAGFIAAALAAILLA